MKKITLIAAIAFIAAGCGGTTKSNAPDPTTNAMPADCLTVPAASIDAVRGSLDPGVTAQGFRATTSTNSGGTIYVIAATIHGPTVDDVARWATPDMANPGTFYSADTTASTYSAWGLPPGGALYGEDGFEEAKTCAEAAAGG